MNSRRGRTLAERAALSRGEPPKAQSELRRHCWIHDLPETPGRWPGLLVEWRRSSDGTWQGRVVYAVDDRDNVVLVETWVDAAHLQSAD